MNKITLIGRLGRDPETRTISTGTSCVNFSLATSRKWKDKATGAINEKTEWHKIVAWGKQGETLAQYLHKGDQFALIGELRYSEWTDKEGNKRTTAEIHLEEFDFINSKPKTADLKKPPLGGGPPDREDDIPF